MGTFSSLLDSAQRDYFVTHRLTGLDAQVFFEHPDAVLAPSSTKRRGGMVQDFDRAAGDDQLVFFHLGSDTLGHLMTKDQPELRLLFDARTLQRYGQLGFRATDGIYYFEGATAACARARAAALTQWDSAKALALIRRVNHLGYERIRSKVPAFNRLPARLKALLPAIAPVDGCIDDELVKALQSEWSYTLYDDPLEWMPEVLLRGTVPLSSALAWRDSYRGHWQAMPRR